MRRSHLDRATTPLTDDGSNRLLIATGWTLWDNALLLVICSLLLLVVLVPFVMLASVAGWLVAWAPMVLASAPVWLATIAVSDRLLGEGGVRVLELPSIICEYWRPAMQLALVPALFGSLGLGLLEFINGEESPILARLLIPVTIGTLLAVAVLIGPAFAAVARTSLGPNMAWLTAARQVVSQPVQQIGLVACFGILCWLAVVIGPALLLGLGPLAVLTTALARTSTNDQATLDTSAGKRRS